MTSELQAELERMEREGGYIEVHAADTGEHVATLRSADEAAEFGRSHLDEPDRLWAFLYCQGER